LSTETRKSSGQIYLFQIESQDSIEKHIKHKHSPDGAERQVRVGASIEMQIAETYSNIICVGGE
jgi:hypothetical protein